MNSKLVAFLIFVSPGILLGVFLYFFSESVSPVYPLLKQRKKTLIDKNKAEVEALSIGNSHSGAVDFNTLKFNGIHYWDAAEDIYETRYKLQYLLKHYKKLKKIFIPISPYLPLQNNAEVFYHAQYHPRIRLHVSTNSWKPLQYKFNYLLLGKLSPVLRYDHWAFLPKMISGISDFQVSDPRLESVEDNGFLKFKYSEIASVKMLENACSYNVREHKRLLVGNDFIELFFTELENIIMLLKENKIQLILYTPPYYQYYNHLTRELEGANSIERIAEFANKKKVFYKDFSEYSLISNNWKYFEDGTHLNKQGRAVFSKLLISNLEEFEK